MRDRGLVAETSKLAEDRHDLLQSLERMLNCLPLWPQSWPLHRDLNRMPPEQLAFSRRDPRIGDRTQDRREPRANCDVAHRLALHGAHRAELRPPKGLSQNGYGKKSI